MSNWDVFNDTFQNAEVKSNYSVLPKGNYQMRFTKFVIDEAKYKIEEEVEVIAGEYAGRKLRNFINMTNPDNTINNISMEQVKKQMYALDPGFGDLSFTTALLGFRDEVLGKAFNGFVSVKEYTSKKDGTQKKNNTFYINEFLTGVTPSEIASTSSQAADY